MVCRHCGKELIKIGELTEKEVEELAFINKKSANAMQALNIETINGMKFTDGQVFEYFRAAFDNKAQAEFLNYIFFRDLAKRLGRTDFTIGNGEPDNHDIFVHPDGEVKDKE